MTDFLGRRFAPPPGGRERLAARLQAAVVQDRREALLLRSLVGGLAAALLIVALAPPVGKSDALREAAFVLDAGGDRSSIRSSPSGISGGAVEYPSAAPGTRLYWVFR